MLEARAQLGIATGQIFPAKPERLRRFQPQRPQPSKPPTATTSQGPFSTSGTTASISTGNSTSGAASAGRSNRTPPRWTPRSKTMTMSWLPCSATWQGTTCRCALFEGQIEYANDNVRLQRETLTIAEARFKGGNTSELDVYQARSTLEQTEAQIPELEISLRQTVVQLCILLGMPPEELQSRLGPAPIPTTPPEVAIGMPADLLRRRPDVRRAERLAAAQCADRRRPGRLLSGLLDQRHDRIFGAAVSRPFPPVGTQWKRRSFRFSGTC